MLDILLCLESWHRWMEGDVDRYLVAYSRHKMNWRPFTHLQDLTWSSEGTTINININFEKN